MEELRECKKHGLTAYAYAPSSRRWRCKKCLVEAVQKRRDEIKELSVQYKGGKCQICGYDTCIGALEFHHLDPTKKDFGIGSKGYTRSWGRVQEELDKCIMVCANCHREIHAGLIDLSERNTDTWKYNSIVSRKQGCTAHGFTCQNLLLACRDVKPYIIGYGGLRPFRTWWVE